MNTEEKTFLAIVLSLLVLLSVAVPIHWAAKDRIRRAEEQRQCLEASGYYEAEKTLHEWHVAAIGVIVDRDPENKIEADRQMNAYISMSKIYDEKKARLEQLKTEVLAKCTKTRAEAKGGAK